MQNIINFLVNKVQEVQRFFSAFKLTYVATPANVRHFAVYCIFIFIPCFLVSTCIAGERPELFNCYSMEQERVVKEFPGFDIPKLSGQGQAYLCWGESGTELGSGNIPGGDINSGNGSPSAENTSEIDTSKSASRCNERPWTCLTESEKKKGQEVMYHFIGGILGLVIGSLLLLLANRQS